MPASLVHPRKAGHVIIDTQALRIETLLLVGSGLPTNPNSDSATLLSRPGICPSAEPRPRRTLPSPHLM